MIKVCHVTSAHPIEDGRIFHKECASLFKAGYDVYLVQRGETYKKNGIKIIGFGDVLGNRFVRMTKYAYLAYSVAVAVDADIYHLHDPELLPYALFLKKRGKIVIFDSHEVYVDQLRNKPYLKKPVNFIVAKLYGIFETFVFNRIDALIVSSLRNGMFPISTSCKHKIVIDNLPSLDLYRSFKENNEKLPRSICCFGTLAHSRGITNLIVAAAKADANLYLAGNFQSEEYKNELMQKQEFNNVNYLGILKPEEIKMNLQKMLIGSAFLLNVGQYNLDDNLPTKAYEYMSMGIPVILSRCKYNDFLNEKYKFGICVDPMDICEIAKVIQFLIEHPVEAKQMGLNGRKLIKERLNWEEEEKKLNKLYRELHK